MYIGHKRPRWKQVCEKLIKPFSLAVLIVIIPLALMISWFVIYLSVFLSPFYLSCRYLFLLITPRQAFAGLLLPLTGYTLSFIIAKLLRQSWSDSRTIMIETGIQNASMLIYLSVYLSVCPSIYPCIYLFLQ